MASYTYTTEEFHKAANEWRGIEEPCKECGGAGTKAYGDTSTWQGGVGGQTITSGVCDKCWGSGDLYIKWPSHREFYSLKKEIERLKEKLK